MDFIEVPAMSLEELLAYKFDTKKKYILHLNNDNINSIYDQAHYDETHIIPKYISTKENITEIILDDDVTSLCHGVVLNNKYLKKVYISKNIEYICSTAFSHCTVKFEVSPENKLFYSENGILYKNNGVLWRCAKKVKTLRVKSGIQYIWSHAFQSNTSLQNIILPKGIEGIGVCSFENCSFLKSINFPLSVRTIDTSAFYNCVRMTSPVILPNLENLGAGAFFGCNKLSNVRLSKLEYLGKDAFDFCDSLKEVSFLCTKKDFNSFKTSLGKEDLKITFEEEDYYDFFG